MPTGVYKRKKPLTHGRMSGYTRGCRCNECTEAMRAYGREARAATAWVAEYKESHPCTDCGGYFPSECMDFDHRPGEVKLRNIGKMSNYRSHDLIREEIAKCDLVCANCHRTRTRKRNEC